MFRLQPIFRGFGTQVSRRKEPFARLLELGRDKVVESSIKLYEKLAAKSTLN